jgi:RNA polymerase sigma factor (sigma-70 family)
MTTATCIDAFPAAGDAWLQDQDRAAGRDRFPVPVIALTLSAMDERSIDGVSTGIADEASDDALMLAYGAGDVSAFEQLYNRHRGRLYRFLLRHLRNQALADEMFQDVWQRLIAARERWQPDAPFGTWLYRIAHNRLADHWRAQQHRPPAPIDADARTARIPDDDTPERTLSEFEQRRQLQLALDALPPEQREVLLLRLEQDLTLEEIGAITGVGRETVKSRLRYAMDKLRTGMPA